MDVATTLNKDVHSDNKEQYSIRIVVDNSDVPVGNNSNAVGGNDSGEGSGDDAAVGDDSGDGDGSGDAYEQYQSDTIPSKVFANTLR